MTIGEKDPFFFTTESKNHVGTRQKKVPPIPRSNSSNVAESWENVHKKNLTFFPSFSCVDLIRLERF